MTDMQENRYAWPYANESGQRETLSCDVLVLGGGLAGCFAAIAAARAGQSVILVEKGAVEKSGSAGTGFDHWESACTNPCSRVTPEEIFLHPTHPYTRALMDAIPIPSIESKHKVRQIIQGEVTSPINPKPGCRFAARCPHAMERCTRGDVEMREVSPGHLVACTLEEGQRND